MARPAPMQQPPIRRLSLYWFALLPDQLMQARGGDPGGLAKLYGMHIATGNQFVELGPTHTDHAGGIVDPDAYWIGERVHDTLLSP